MGGGNNNEISDNDYYFGYNSSRIAHMYDEGDFYDGKEVALEPYVTTIFNEKATYRANEEKGIWTGALDVGHIS